MNYDLVILCSGCLKVGETIPANAGNVRPRLREGVLRMGWKSTGSEMWCPACAPHWRDYLDNKRIVRALETHTDQVRALYEALEDAKAIIEEYDARAVPFDGAPTSQDILRNQAIRR